MGDAEEKRLCVLYLQAWVDVPTISAPCLNLLGSGIPCVLLVHPCWLREEERGVAGVHPPAGEPPVSSQLRAGSSR